MILFNKKNCKWMYVLNLIFLLYAPNSIAAKLNFQLHGIQGEPLDNVNTRLQILVKNFNGNIPNAKIHSLYLQAKDEIKKGIQPYGYFRATISSKLIKNPNGWDAVYYIYPGEPLRITHIQTEIHGEGQHNIAMQNFLQKFPLKENEVFTVPSYDKAKTTLFTIAKNEGYLRASFKNKIRVDLKHYTCFILIDLDTGQQFYFGHLNIKTYPYSENFIRRFLDIHPGEVFSSKKLLTLQQAMEKSYYFKRVVFEPDFQQPKQQEVPIDTFLYPPKEKRYRLGLGYGTLTGPRISAGLSLRHLGNEGHHFEAEVKTSKILSSISGTYYIPGKEPLHDEWFVGANAKLFVPKMGLSKSATLSGGFTKKYDTWSSSWDLNYLIEKFRILGASTHTAHMFFPSWKTSYVKSDNLADPQNAFSTNLTLQAASETLLSTTSFAQVQSHTKVIWSPLSFGRFIFHGDVGLTAVHNISVFPMSLQFITGGMTSIRGFADSSIGPGKYLLIGSAEYQHRIKGSLYGAIFYDVGLAANHLPSPWNRGAGIGAVYDTKIGPFKIYLARALSKSSHPNSIEFSVGPEFS